MLSVCDPPSAERRHSNEPPRLNFGAIFRGLKRENPASLSTHEVTQLRHMSQCFFYSFSADRLQ